MITSAARVEGPTTLGLYAVGAKANGTSLVWPGGRCSGNVSRVVLCFFSDKALQSKAVEERATETRAPEDESSEAPDVEKEVVVTLKNDGTFKHIYEATGQQYVVATHKYSDKETVSSGVAADADRSAELTVTTASDQQGFQSGGTIKISFKGSALNQEFEMYMYSKPVRIGISTTSSDSSTDVDVKIPSNTTPGRHHLTARVKNMQRAIFLFILKNKSGAKDDIPATEGSTQFGSGQRGKVWKTGGQMPAKWVTLKPGLPWTGY